MQHSEPDPLKLKPMQNAHANVIGMRGQRRQVRNQKRFEDMTPRRGKPLDRPTADVCDEKSEECTTGANALKQEASCLLIDSPSSTLSTPPSRIPPSRLISAPSPDMPVAENDDSVEEIGPQKLPPRMSSHSGINPRSPRRLSDSERQREEIRQLQDKLKITENKELVTRQELEALKSEAVEFAPFLNEMREIKGRGMLSFYEALQRELEETKESLRQDGVEYSSLMSRFKAKDAQIRNLEMNHEKELQQMLDVRKRLEEDVRFLEDKIDLEERKNLELQDKIRLKINEVSGLKIENQKLPELRNKSKQLQSEVKTLKDTVNNIKAELPTKYQDAQTPRRESQGTSPRKSSSSTLANTRRPTVEAPVVSPAKKRHGPDHTLEIIPRLLKKYHRVIFFFIWVCTLVHFVTLATC